MRSKERNKLQKSLNLIFNYYFLAFLVGAFIGNIIYAIDNGNNLNDVIMLSAGWTIIFATFLILIIIAGNFFFNRSK